MKKVRPGANENLAKQAMPNVIFNFIPFILTALVGLYLVPFFIGKLGIVAYSVVPLALSITGYVTLVSDALSNSIGRYLAVAVQKGDSEEAERVYSTAFFGLLKIALLMVPVVILISFSSVSMFNLTWADPLTVQILFLGVLGSVIVIAWSSLFLMVLFASNRLDLVGIVKSIQIILQFGLIFILLSAGNPNVSYIGISYILASGAFMLIGWIFAKRVQPHLKVSRSNYDGAYFKEMCGLGGWTLINNLGALLFIQMSLIMVNRLLGSESGGNFGIVVSVISMVFSSTTILSEVFAPPIYRYYSLGDRENMNYVSKFSVKATGIALAFPIAFVCVFSADLLTVWVGEHFIFLSDILWAMLGLMVGIQAIIPAFTLTMAYKSMRIPAIFSLVFGMGNVALLLIFHHFTDWGIMGAAIAWTASVFLKNCVFMPLYISDVTGTGKKTYFIPLAQGFAYFGASVLICLFIDLVLGMSFGLLGLVAMFLILYGLYGIIVVRTMRKRERGTLLSCLPASVSSRPIVKKFFD